MTGDALPPCLGCGTCCFSKLTTYAGVTGSDHARLGEHAEALTLFVGNRCYMKMHEGHCAALVIDVSCGRFVCSVYDSRPSVCRELERGSPACHGELHEKGARPGALLRMLEQRGGSHG
ncbi:MAG TPA: YkgJ family cysteine cluster protein [Polyangiaceae bacterium]|nr:YkgJ family cysteine cluster protein [Polyangiaceae bacterium]